jgi:hypothetical protein
VTHTAEIISIAEYLNTKQNDQCVNTVKSHGSSQSNMNSTIRTATRVAED